MLGEQASDELEPDAAGGPPRFTQRLRALEAQLQAQRVCVLDPLLAVRQVSPTEQPACLQDIRGVLLLLPFLSWYAVMKLVLLHCFVTKPTNVLWSKGMQVRLLLRYPSRFSAEMSTAMGGRLELSWRWADGREGARCWTAGRCVARCSACRRWQPLGAWRCASRPPPGYEACARPLPAAILT